VSVLATHSIRQFPLHFPSRASPCSITFQTHSTSRAELNRWQWHMQLSISQGYNSYAKLPEVFCSADTSYLVCKTGDNENLLHHTLNRRVKIMTSRMSVPLSSRTRCHVEPLNTADMDSCLRSNHCCNIFSVCQTTSLRQGAVSHAPTGMTTRCRTHF